MRAFIVGTSHVGEAILRFAAVILFAVMIVTVSYEVVMRYVFGAPTFWSEELARTSMIWLVMLGFALGIRHQANIRVDFLLEAFPTWAQRAAAWARFACVAAFAIVLLVHGWQLASSNMRQTMPGLGIGVFWLYLSVPVSAVAMLLFTAELILKGERGAF
ncbi:TRAP transporter small permease [Acuticoccus sp.]|uniref:TRAP transporter small permease n=1 Tax=Acuticoccus sp. TaxID=1904378 RepID=UPI003B528FFE